MGILGGRREIDIIDRMGIIDMGIIGLLYIIGGEDGMCMTGI